MSSFVKGKKTIRNGKWFSIFPALTASVVHDCERGAIACPVVLMVTSIEQVITWHSTWLLKEFILSSKRQRKGRNAKISLIAVLVLCMRTKARPWLIHFSSISLWVEISQVHPAPLVAKGQFPVSKEVNTSGPFLPRMRAEHKGATVSWPH